MFASLNDGFSLFDESVAPANSHYSDAYPTSNVNSNAAALALSACNTDSKKTISEVKLATELKFKKGVEWNEDSLIKELTDFAHSFHFKLRKSKGREMLCSKASTSHSKKIAKGDLHLTRKGCSQVTNCPWKVRWNRTKKLPLVDIMEVVSEHNHDCDIALAVVSQRLSGKSVKNAVDAVYDALAPLLASGKPVKYNLIRSTIKPYVAPGVELHSKVIENIVRSVKKRMTTANYMIPHTISADEMKAFTSVDIASENCGAVLRDLIAYTDAETSWVIHRVMHRLKEKDPLYFSYRIQYNESDEIVCVTWQTGPSRAAFELYGRIVFLDARKNENMNVDRMRYISFIVIDSNKQIIPASESFVYEESVDGYKNVVTNTFDMTPNRSPDSVRLGFGDDFLKPDDVKSWMPNIHYMLEFYHLCSKGNETSVWAKEFGPKVWPIIGDDMRAAVRAETKDSCLVSCYIVEQLYCFFGVQSNLSHIFFIFFSKQHIEAALKLVNGNQSARDKIVKWQNKQYRWAQHERNHIIGHQNIEAGSYVEQNHSSIKAIAGDDASRSVEKNILDVMERTHLIYMKLQRLKHTWSAQAAMDLNNMNGVRRDHLSEARRGLDRLAFQWFTEQYDMYPQYNVDVCLVDGKHGVMVKHTSRNSCDDGYFIPDTERDELNCPCHDCFAMQNICRHLIAKRIFCKQNPFCKEIVDGRHIFISILPKTISKLDDSVLPWENAASTDTVFDDTNEDAPIPGQRTDTSNNNNGSNIVVGDSYDAVLLHSPSKSNIASRHSQLAQQDACRRAPNVNYKQLVVAGNQLASAVGSQSNEIQNAIFNMLVGMKDMVDKQDFTSCDYEGTVFGPLAQQIASLVSHQKVSHVKGKPKAKYGNRLGKAPEYRLGSSKSTSSRLPNNCSFCGGGGGGRHHTSMAKCPLKLSFGFCYDIKKDITLVGTEVGNIFMGGSHGFIDVETITDFSEHTFIKDSFPTGTRRLQIKGYMTRMSERFLLCDCINNKGMVITREEGTGMVSYQNVFLSEMCVMTNLKVCDYIFFKPVGPRSNSMQKEDIPLDQDATELEAERDIPLDHDATEFDAVNTSEHDAKKLEAVDTFEHDDTEIDAQNDGSDSDVVLSDLVSKRNKHSRKAMSSESAGAVSFKRTIDEDVDEKPTRKSKRSRRPTAKATSQKENDTS